MTEVLVSRAELGPGQRPIVLLSAELDAPRPPRTSGAALP